MATRGPGRPQFKPTAAQRRKVASAKAYGMSEESIALALGIAINTLRKHFELELTTGAAVKRMEALDALQRAAKRGNVSAIKVTLLLATATEAPRPPAEGEGDTPPAPAPAPAQRLGKKEAAQIAAGSAADGTDWAGLLPGSPRVQ